MWRPFAVLPSGELAADVDVVQVAAEANASRWRFPRFTVELHPTEAEGYYLNLTSADPCVFVMWRMSEDGAMPLALPVIVTVSYNEAGRMMDGGERVDSVALPAEIADWMRPFVATHYKPEPRKKVRRNSPRRERVRARSPRRRNAPMNLRHLPGGARRARVGS